MHEQIEKLKELILGVWVKKHYLIISTWLICPIGWFAISALPDQYEASARVYVDTQSLLRPLMKDLMVETDPNTQIRLMVKTLLSRPNLERIARMTDLDLVAENSGDFEKILKDLKDDIKINSAGRENIYTLTIREKTPQLAKNIVQAALTVFIENTLGETRSDTDTAQKFLQKQISDYEVRLLSAEKKLTEFKQKYSGIMPSDSNGFYSALDTAKRLLKATNLQLLETQTRLDSARQQLNKENSISSKYSDNVMEDSTITTTYDESILKLQSSLDELLISYTEQHPDVREMQRRLIELKKLRRTEVENYYSSEDGEAASSNNTSPVSQAMKIQINTLENEVASLQVRTQDYENQVYELNQKIHVLPEVEAELVGLNRDYEINKRKYEELLSRRETASMAKQADATSDKIQFRVIDPPRAPLEPSGPYRILFFIATFIVAIGLGIGTAIFSIQINPLVISSSQLSRETHLPIFGVVSASEKLTIVGRNKKNKRIFMASNLFLFIVLLALVGYYLSPDLMQPQLKRIF